MFTEFYEGGFYHVYGRGVDKRLVYEEDADKRFFLSRVCKYQRDEMGECVEVVAFCLMDNHYHMLIRQANKRGVTRFMRKLLTSYVMYFNRKYERTGTLFESTFKRKCVDTDGYLGNVVRYIHLNAVDLMSDKEATPKQILKFVKEYEWSDASEYIDSRGGLSDFFDDISYRDFLYGELLFPRSDLGAGFEV
jgi:putative transposase